MKKPRRKTGLRRIISGGQTGADRGGLDAAIEMGIPHGGWCPKGRRAEDGPVPKRYRLRETESRDYPARTERNVLEADGTVVFSLGRLDRGSALTLALARRHKRPSLHLDLRRLGPARAARRLRQWVDRRGIAVLNVAGPREGTARGIRRLVWEILATAFSASRG